MNVTAIPTIERTLQKTAGWLGDLKQELGWKDDQKTFRALRAVLHALRDRLTAAEAVDLGAQLPLLIRGLYYEGWTPNGKPVKERRREDFLAHIASAFNGEPEVFPEAVAWGVFKLLQSRVSAGEIGDLKAILPAEIGSLWPGNETVKGS
jgi:uncharacterized protein (DUF2267 family)